jgi:hypothetical protein
MPLTAETHPLSGKKVLVARVVSGVFSGLSAGETSIHLGFMEAFHNQTIPALLETLDYLVP